MTTKIRTDEYKFSTPLTNLIELKLILSTGKKVTIINPKEDINRIMNFIENPKNKFFHIGLLTVDIDEIIFMECYDYSCGIVTLQKKIVV